MLARPPTSAYTCRMVRGEAVSGSSTIVGDDGVRWQSFSSAGGATVFFRVEGKALENVIVGHMDAPVAERLMHEFDLVEQAHGSFVGFHSWLNAPTYSTEYRGLWMKWLADKNTSGALKETHFLTSSRIVRMGLTVANIAYPKIRFGIHETEPSYLAARRVFMTDAVTPPPRR